jgi:hypothetical protein
MELILQARITLLRFLEVNRAIDREEIVAYAALDAFCSHYPEQATDEDTQILVKSRRILEEGSSGRTLRSFNGACSLSAGLMAAV